MPTYAFEDVQSGERMDLVLPLSRAPGYGNTIQQDGRVLRRLFDADSVQITKPFKPYVTRVVPKRAAGFKHDAAGRCVVETRRQEQDYAKRHKLEWE